MQAVNRRALVSSNEGEARALAANRQILRRKELL